MSADSTIQDGSMPEAATEWVRKSIGSFDVMQRCRVGSNRTGVWKLKSRTGQHYFKLNRRRVRWGTEVFVYKNWARAFGRFAPELQGVLDEEGLNGLLVSALEGVPLREVALSEIDRVKTYARAGELCAKLHALQVGSWFGIMDEKGNPVTFTGGALSQGQPDAAAYYGQAICESLQAAEAKGAIDSSQRETVARVIDSLSGIAFPRPVPTCFDYTPGNWIVDGSGNFRGLIDFENFGWGLPADPFARLVVDYFPNDAPCAEAFYAGYGSRPPEESRDQVRIGCLLYALSYMTLAAEHGRANDAERARRAFAFCSD